MVIIIIGPLRLRQPANGSYQGLVTDCDENSILQVFDLKRNGSMQIMAVLKMERVLSGPWTVIRSPVSQAQAEATVHGMRSKTTCPKMFRRGAQLKKRAGTVKNNQDKEGLTASKGDHYSLGIFHAQLTHRYLASPPFVSSDSAVITFRCSSLAARLQPCVVSIPCFCVSSLLRTASAGAMAYANLSSTIATSLRFVLCRFRLSPRCILE
jgi:hypothetical protein